MERKAQCYLQFCWRQEHSTPHRAMWGSTGADQESERSEGKAYVTAFFGASVEKSRQGRVNSLGLASLNTSGGLWGTRAIPSYQVPGPRLVQGKGNIGLVCEGQIKGAIDLPLGGLLLGKLFTVFRNIFRNIYCFQIAQRGVVSPHVCKAPPMSKHHKIQNTNKPTT